MRMRTIRNFTMLGYLVLCLAANLIRAVDFVDITNDVFTEGQYLGVIAAFGDFNSDKLTDVFCIRKDGKTVEVLLAYAEKPYLRSSSIYCTLNGVISGVMPADFNGDSMMDILVFQAVEGEKKVMEAKILWGFFDHLKCSNSTEFMTHGEPLLVDYNGDMVPDLMGEDNARRRTVWLSSSNKTFTNVTVDSGTALQHLPVPHSSAVLDVNGDMASDIIITGELNMEVWINHGRTFSHHKNISYPQNYALGQSSFVDFNCNGRLDHILPVCHDRQCKSCAVMVRKTWDNGTSDWITLIGQFDFANTSWCFKVEEGSGFQNFLLPVILRAGDYDMDGYPDFIAVLQSLKSKETKTVLLQNIPSTENAVGRSLKIRWNTPGLGTISTIHLATFYDIFEDGKMDILATSKNAKDMWEVRALQNVHTYDACFFKVLVLSGLCYTDCEMNKIPYGTNQPGPMIIYNTTRPDGEPLAGCAVQMSQSAYFSLQLPYSVFGLGETPNFVDHLTVAITSMSNNQTHKREWSQIIPNSQMVVIPHPPDNEHRWVNKLFVTPSHLVLLTFVALVSTCGFIAIIVGILHWKERREDKIEKMQDAYRFHFDAM